MSLHLSGGHSVNVAAHGFFVGLWQLADVLARIVLSLAVGDRGVFVLRPLRYLPKQYCFDELLLPASRNPGPTPPTVLKSPVDCSSPACLMFES